MKNLYNEQDVVKLFTPADIAYTDAYSDIIDVSTAEGVNIIASIGVLTGLTTARYLTPTLQECATTVTGSFTAVAAADMIRQDGTAAVWDKIDDGAEDDVTFTASYIGKLRYVRVFWNITTDTTAPSGYVGAWAVISHAAVSPPSYAITATT
jgi:hypothetical protein